MHRRQVHAGAKQRTFQPRQLANLLWALATLGARDETAIIDAIMEACLDADVRAFKSQEMSNAVWAMATLGTRDCASILTFWSKHARSALMTHHQSTPALQLDLTLVLEPDST